VKCLQHNFTTKVITNDDKTIKIIIEKEETETLLSYYGNKTELPTRKS
jgi:hypothetical protein